MDRSRRTPQPVSDDDESNPSFAADAVRPPSPTGLSSRVPAVENASSGATSDADFEALRREFLIGTARSLSLSRVRSAQQFKGLVDDLGLAVARLRDVRAEIDRACELHATLESLISRDLSSAESTSARHHFNIYREDEELQVNETTAENVVDMFMESVVTRESAQ